MDPRTVQLIDDLLAAALACPQDLSWQSHYTDEQQLRDDLRDHADRAHRDDDSRLQELKLLLLPTGSLCEIAHSSGWGVRYTTLANRFDELFRPTAGIRVPRARVVSPG